MRLLAALFVLGVLAAPLAGALDAQPHSEETAHDECGETEDGRTCVQESGSRDGIRITHEGQAVGAYSTTGSAQGSGEHESQGQNTTWRSDSHTLVGVAVTHGEDEGPEDAVGAGVHRYEHTETTVVDEESATTQEWGLRIAPTAGDPGPTIVQGERARGSHSACYFAVVHPDADVHVDEETPCLLA